MSNTAFIRLLVADELPYSHGVENVSLALVKEFTELVEQVTWVTARPDRSRELEQLFPNPGMQSNKWFPATYDSCNAHKN